MNTKTLADFLIYISVPLKLKKDKNNKFMSFLIDNEKLLEKYRAIWTKIVNLANIELNALQSLMIDI